MSAPGERSNGALEAMYDDTAADASALTELAGRALSGCASDADGGGGGGALRGADEDRTEALFVCADVADDTSPGIVAKRVNALASLLKMKVGRPFARASRCRASACSSATEACSSSESSKCSTAIERREGEGKRVAAFAAAAVLDGGDAASLDCCVARTRAGEILSSTGAGAGASACAYASSTMPAVGEIDMRAVVGERDRSGGARACEPLPSTSGPNGHGRGWDAAAASIESTSAAFGDPSTDVSTEDSAAVGKAKCTLYCCEGLAGLDTMLALLLPLLS
jgi:hypothetical protein